MIKHSERVLALLSLMILFCLCCFGLGALPLEEQQLADLQGKQILIFNWGWSVDEMAPVARKFGFQVVNARYGNNIDAKTNEVASWSRHGSS